MKPATGVVLVGAVGILLACTRQAPAPGVEIVEPKDGAVVTGPNVNVVLKATGIEIVAASEQKAGTAHHHLFLDMDPTPATDTIPQGVTGMIHLGRAQTEFLFEGLTPGEHRVVAVLADPWHVPTSGAQTATVRFTVQ